MQITNLTIIQDGQVITATKSKEAAVSTAQARAKMTGGPVSVVARPDDGSDREVIFNPDGTNRPLAKLHEAVKIADTSDQGKTKSKAVSAIAVTF